MAAGAAKGAVTALTSLFSVEDAQKAASSVQETLSHKQKEFDHLLGFISDNTNLINVVQKLPEELCHDIMVPFGKAAFFPGRLIHTNEFLVLLGEGYYADRTSKQTVEILKRRGKTLESQVDSLKAMMQDLKVQASFFESTASEAAEGLVEIREDYVEDKSTEREFESGPNKLGGSPFSEVENEEVAVGDEEYAHIMSRLDELENEELAAGSDYESDVDDQSKAILNKFSDKKLLEDNDSYSESRIPLWKKQDENSTQEINENHHQQDPTDILNCTGLTVPVPKDDSPHREGFAHDVVEEPEVFHKVRENVQAVSSSRSEVSDRSSRPGFDGNKAFTGSIIEHDDNLPKIPKEVNPTPSQSSGSQPSKPVSRFKMQRR